MVSGLFVAIECAANMKKPMQLPFKLERYQANNSGMN